MKKLNDSFGPTNIKVWHGLRNLSWINCCFLSFLIYAGLNVVREKFIYFSWTYFRLGLYFPCSSVFKESAYNVGDLGSIPGSGRSPGEGNGNSVQYCCLESPMDRGAWWAAVYGVAQSRTRLKRLSSSSKSKLQTPHKYSPSMNSLTFPYWAQVLHW